MYDVTNSVDSGRVIAFWSPVHRQGAVSATVAMMACFMAEKILEAKEDDKLLVLSNELYGAPTAANYMVKDMMPDGLTEVVELSSSDNLKTSADIYNNTFSGVSRVDILNSSKRNTNIEDYLSREIPNIFNVARSGYKFTLVDTVAGTFDEASRQILRTCDMIVVCMPQDKYLFDSWIRKMPGIFIQEADKKPVLIISEKHYEYEHMKYSQMKKELKKELYYISLNDIVHKAVSERDIPTMIRSWYKSKTPDDIILELDAIYSQILTDLDNIVQLEIQRALEEEEESKQKTKEYLDTVDNLFGEDMYGSSDDEDESGIPDEASIEAFMSSTSSSSEDEDNVSSEEDTTEQEDITSVLGLSEEGEYDSTSVLEESPSDDEMADMFGLSGDSEQSEYEEEPQIESEEAEK